MTRRRLSTKARLEVFTRAGGVCHICGATIWPGEPWEVEHVIPIAQGGEDGGDNLAPAHVDCHASKTAQDAANTARAKRLQARHLGAKAPSRAVVPGSKRSPWKKRLDGSVVRR